MKKLFVFFFVVLAGVVQVFAQTEKGSMFSGPGMSIYYNHENSTYTSSITGITNKQITQNAGIGLSAGIGYFVANNLAIGPGISLGYSWYKSEYSYYYSKEQSVYFGFNPFVRYYIGNTGKLKFFTGVQLNVNPGVSYQEYNEVDVYGSSVRKFTNLSLSLGGGAEAGIVYFINPVIGLEGSLSYNYKHTIYYNDNSGTTEQSGLDNSHNFNLGFGFAYYFARKQKEQ